MAPVGSVLKESDIRRLWHGPEAAKIRKDTIECERLCLLTCLSKKTIGDKLTQGLESSEICAQKIKSHSELCGT